MYIRALHLGVIDRSFYSLRGGVALVDKDSLVGADNIPVVTRSQPKCPSLNEARRRCYLTDESWGSWCRAALQGGRQTLRAWSVREKVARQLCSAGGNSPGRECQSTTRPLADYSDVLAPRRAAAPWALVAPRRPWRLRSAGVGHRRLRSCARPAWHRPTGTEPRGRYEHTTVRTQVSPSSTELCVTSYWRQNVPKVARNVVDDEVRRAA